jgi:DNA-binding transcriptional LysR family regulator
VDRFDLMVAFVRTVETGSLSSAARELGTTQPTVSKRLGALEAQVGARLLQRNTQGIRLTEAGDRYYETSKRVLGELDQVEADLAGLRRSLTGKLRLNLPVGFGELHLTRLSLEFLRQHPTLQLDLTLTDRLVDLVEDGADVAVRIGAVNAQAVVARRLGQFGYVFVATPAYLEKHGTPKRAEDLAEHNYLRYGGTAEECVQTPSGPVTFRPHCNVSLNNSLALRAAFLEGLGLGRAVRWLVDEDIRQGKLKELLPGCGPAPLDCHALYLPSRYVPEKVRAYVTFLLKAIQKVPGWMPLP